MEKLFSEIDFLRIKSPPSHAPVGLSSGGIQSVLFNCAPRIFQSGMAEGESGGLDPHRSFDSCLTSNTSFSAGEVAAGRLPWSLPFLDPDCRTASINFPESPTLTIFYNGTVLAANIPRVKAEAIISAVESVIPKKPEQRSQRTLAEANRPDLPIMRRKSLCRFLEKRKKRLQAAIPYDKPTMTTDSC